MSTEIKTGTYTGNAAAQTISLGWIPDRIEVINATDKTAKYTWTGQMAAGTAVFEQAVVDNAATGNASMSALATNGITAFAGSSSAAPGFTIGTSLSTNAKVYSYIAYRTDAPA